MIGKRIREQRKKKQWTQLDLADKLNLTKSTISMYENENSEPSFEVEEKVANLFGVSLDYLRGRSDIPQPTEVQPNSALTTESIYDVYADPDAWIKKLAAEYKEKTGRDLEEWKREAILNLVEANRPTEDSEENKK